MALPPSVKVSFANFCARVDWLGPAGMYSNWQSVQVFIR